MIFILNLMRHATFHGHNSMYVRRPDPFPFREGCGYTRLPTKGVGAEGGSRRGQQWAPRSFPSLPIPRRDRSRQDLVGGGYALDVG